jgi:hypothetical protein
MTPRFVPASAAAIVQPTQGIQLDLRRGKARTRTPVAFAESWTPPGVPHEQEPRPGQAVAGRFVIEARVRALGAGTLYRAADMDLGEEVLILAEPAGPNGAGQGRREVRTSGAVRHLNLLRQLESGTWDGLRFASFVAPPGEPLVNMALPLGGRLPALHVATIASRAVAGLSALHDNGQLLGGVYPGSILVGPWGLQVWLVGWGERSSSSRFGERSRAELRSLGKILVRLRGVRGDHPAELELDDLLTLMAAHNLRQEGMPRELLRGALDNVSSALRSR